MGFENDEYDDDMMENKTMDYLILAKSNFIETLLSIY
jgi:hypothetical protein